MKRMHKRNGAKANFPGENPAHFKLAYKPLSTTQAAIPDDGGAKK